MANGSTLENQYDAELLRVGTVENGTGSQFCYYNGELLTKVGKDEEDIRSRYILGYGVV